MFEPDVVAQAILDALTTALGAAAPARRYVTVGMPAWDAQGMYLGDGEQLTVGLLRLLPGQPGRPEVGIQQSVHYAMTTAEFEIELVRLVPGVTEGGTQPPADVMTAAGVARMQEVKLMREALRSISVPGFQPPLHQGTDPAPIALSVMLLASTLKGPDGDALGMSTMIQVGL